MTGRISIPKLRGRASLHKSGDEDKFVGITEGEFRALLDAVEAAHRANYDAPCGYCKYGDDCPNVRLEDALARFDFGEPA